MTLKEIKAVVRESVEDVVADALTDEEVDEICDLTADRLLEEGLAVDDEEDDADSEEE